ncbi:ABC transporter substrate-binding protein [Shewanella sp. UCD-KL12]|uniref:substrate-binding periplasmic protein n=1 Tax=Shewanella sp. UCD-KL12 TaxID=1917163 RepID=UPI0009705F1E|nr:transporter substrate-binding domain-containing protein [Shewanella sp. UCD-KL12]
MKCKLISLLALAIFSFSSKAEEIIIASDIWCPYICENNSGYVVELTEQAFASVGVRVKFETIPFQRALKLAKHNKIHAVLAVTPEHVKQFNLLIYDDAPVGQFSNDFYVRKNSTWRYQSIHSLQQQSIASIRGYDYGPVLNKYLSAHAYHYIASGETPHKINLNLLQRGRVDLFIGNRYVIEHTAKELGYDKYISFAGSENITTPLYVGFSRLDNEAAYAEKFAQGLDNIKQSGVYDAILSKYQIVQ